MHHDEWTPSSKEGYESVHFYATSGPKAENFPEVEIDDAEDIELGWIEIRELGEKRLQIIGGYTLEAFKENLDKIRREIERVWEVGSSDLIETTQKKGSTKRDRGPSPDILKLCKQAMKYWLDDERPLSMSCELAGGPTPKTVKKWIPNVLKLLDEPKRQQWITKLKVLNQEKHLGKFR